MQDINHVVDFITQNLALFFERLLAVSFKYNCTSSLLYIHLNLWTLFYFKKEYYKWGEVPDQAELVWHGAFLLNSVALRTYHYLPTVWLEAAGFL